MLYSLKFTYAIPNKKAVIDECIDSIVEIIGDCDLSDCYQPNSNISIKVKRDAESEVDALKDVKLDLDSALPDNAIFRGSECLSVIFEDTYERTMFP